MKRRDVKLSAAAVMRRLRREMCEADEWREWTGLPDAEKQRYIQGVSVARWLVGRMAEKARKQ